MSGNLYQVQPGDTPSSIARKLGCSVADLQSTNRITDPRKLQVGALLRAPLIRQREQTQRPVDKALAPKAKAPNDKTGTSLPNWSLRGIWQDLSDGAGQVWGAGVRLTHGLSRDVLAWYRENESAEDIQKTSVTKTQPRKPGEQKRPKSAATPSTSGAPRKHKDEVIAQLHERLFATPHVVSMSGVRLSRNERRMIVAAVGLCEINNDVFGSRNLDYEFVGRQFGQRGIETGYSRIVHIGLSYGYIQYTQDGGGLGRVLQRMREKGTREFERHFPNCDQLIQMTTAGLPGRTTYGVSGQKYWSDLKAKPKAELKERADTDANKDGKADRPLADDEQIRGARVQKIPYVKGYPAIDLWEDYKELPSLPTGEEAAFIGYLSAFKAAGDVPAFQDAQIELAVEDYMNPVLAHCKEWNIRSAVGLAFVVACSVRGGAGGSLSKLFTRVAAAKLNIKKFESAQQERECLQAIAEAKVQTTTDSKGRKHTACDVAGVAFDADEARRAKLVMKDEYHFLAEDLYDPETYDAANDK